MLENPNKSKSKNNSKIKYEVSKPNFLIPTKIEKFLQKNPKKPKINIDNENRRKIEKIKEKIVLLQEILKNKSSINSKKAKNSISKERIKKNDRTNNLLDKETLIINKSKKINRLNYIKSPNQTSSNRFYKRHQLYDTFHSRFNSERGQLLNESLGTHNKKDYFSQKHKENSKNMNKKNKDGNYYLQDLSYLDKISKIRNGNYSIDKENTSIDKSINFNLLKNNVKELNLNKDEKNDTKKKIIHSYINHGDSKLSNLNINNNEAGLYSKIKQDKDIIKSLKNLDDEMNSIFNLNNSNFSSRRNLTHNHPITEQIDINHIDNFCKETPSTKNTLKTESRFTDNILNFKNNKLSTVEISLKNSGRKKKLLNKSINKVLPTKKSKLLNNLHNSSKMYLLEKRNKSNNNNSNENKNNNIKTSKSKYLNKLNKFLNKNNINKKTSNISNPNLLEITTSPFVRNKYNITTLPSKRSLNKNIISLKKGPINCKLNFNSPQGYFSIKKNYESVMDINKQYKINLSKKHKHSSFNSSQSLINKIQENYKNNNVTKTNFSKAIINKTEKNSKTNTYKSTKKLKNILNDNNANKNKKEKKEKEEKEEKEEEGEEEREHIPHVFSVTLRQSGFKQKEYPNMAKRLSASQGDISLKNQFEIIKMGNLAFRETKSVKAIESLCKKGFSGPGIKKTNQDNFFIFNNFNNNSNYIYMGVCDGHGIFGQDISTYLVNNLPQNLNKNIINQNIKNLSTERLSSLSKVLKSTFIQTNINLNTDERIDSTFSGSTCVTVLFTPTRLICINVGDSRCVMGKYNNNKKWYSKNLTRDHKPSEPDEMERIISSGGKVEAYRDNFGNFVGPERVWKKEGDAPGLAMSRSFGDEVAHTIGVIVNPEINEYQLLNEDKFFILASDGIWEFISSEEVVNIVKDFYLENDIEGALTYLYKEASKRWIMEEEVIDDITIILVFLN